MWMFESGRISMKFIQYYSGSAGNLYVVVANNGRRLIIDPGVTWKKLQRALAYDLSNIDGALCSHEHNDHSKAARDVLRAGIGVYASRGTLEAVGISDHRKAHSFDDCNRLIVKGFDVMCFEAHHDAAEPLLYVIRSGDECLLFATDTSHIKQRFNIPFSIIAIECSYDIGILQGRVESRDINQTLAERLLTSHQEKQTAMKYLVNYCDLSRCREIHLLHLSNDNIDKEQAKKDFESKFFIETKVI